ncbi:hypothetical protein [Acidiphilium sp.]|uniref:hypothetical protein n=1 Tax=Acidiphilium sp. TaxID=527 RepID=UPI00258B0288|nr:hypothetical protein [Acidiphilium sp.]
MMGIRVPELTGSFLLKVADRALFAALCACIGAVYILDMIFFGSLTAFGALTIVYVVIGAVLRTIAVTAGVFLQKFKPGDRLYEHRGTIRALWIFCVVACLLSALNFFAAGHADKASGVTTAQAVTSATTQTKAARIAAIEAEIDEIEAERDAAVASVTRQMMAIEDDGIPGISAADNQRLDTLRQQEADYREKARTDIAAARERQEKIRNEQDKAVVDGAAASTQASTWQVFVWLGDHTPIDQDAWSNGGLFYFAMLIEFIAAFGLGAYVALKPVYARIIGLAEIEEAAAANRLRAEIETARMKSEADVAMVELQHATARIAQQAELAAARIRADAMRRQIEKQAEDEARLLAGDSPAPAVPETPPAPPPPPPDLPLEDFDPSKLGASNGGAATQHGREVNGIDHRIPVGDWRAPAA